MTSDYGILVRDIIMTSNKNYMYIRSPTLSESLNIKRGEGCEGCDTHRVYTSDHCFLKKEYERKYIRNKVRYPFREQRNKYQALH